MQVFTFKQEMMFIERCLTCYTIWRGYQICFDLCADNRQIGVNSGVNELVNLWNYWLIFVGNKSIPMSFPDLKGEYFIFAF